MDKEACIEGRWKSKLKRPLVLYRPGFQRISAACALCLDMSIPSRRKVTEPGYVNCCSQEPLQSPLCLLLL